MTLTATADATDPRDELWGDPPWPEWLKGFRDHQLIAIAEVMDAYDGGADVVLLDAPTGAGKSVLGEAIRRMLHVKHAMYVSHTKSLQDQFAESFPYAKVLKGRANYPTADSPERFNTRDEKLRLTAGDCAKSFTYLPACGDCKMRDESEDKYLHCDLCHPWLACPYEQAKMQALEADVAVMNTAYFITECNGPGRFSKRPFAIMDEADSLENILMGHVSLEIGPRWQKRLGLEGPKVKGKDAKSNDWLDWAHHAAVVIDNSRFVAEEELAERVDGAPPVAAVERCPVKYKPPVNSIELRREAKHLVSLRTRVQDLQSQLLSGNAIYDGYERGTITFKPISVTSYGPEKIWNHASKWLCMSATFIDPQHYAEYEVGIEAADLTWALVKVPSTFPKENRPIHVKPIAPMSNKEKETSWPEMVDGIQRVLMKHPDERVLVHTVSYALADYLHDHLKMGMSRPYFTYGSAKDRDGTLDAYRKAERSVLFAASMDRGVDLPYDACGVVVVAKVPFPNLGDKQIAARLYGTKGGQQWYGIQTVRSLVQMTGRGVRSETDKCDVYILDSLFWSKVYKDLRHCFPTWWQEAVDRTGGGI